MQTRPTKSFRKALQLRHLALLSELAGIATSSRPDGVKALMSRCVEESIADTRRQISELGS